MQTIGLLPEPEHSQNIYAWLSKVVTYFFLVVPAVILRDCIERFTAKSSRKRHERRCMAILSATEDHATWLKEAATLDQIRGFEDWRHEGTDRECCSQRDIECQIRIMENLLQRGDMSAIGTYLTSSLNRNLFGVTEPSLFAPFNCGTKKFVEDYHVRVIELIQVYSCQSMTCVKSTVVSSNASLASQSITPAALSPVSRPADDGNMKMQSESTNSSFSLADHMTMCAPPQHVALLKLPKTRNFPTSREKIQTLRQASHMFGRSALLLSGGAALGIYHSGVIRVLWKAQLMPNVIAGSSAGAIIASVLCTRTDNELNEIFESDNDGFLKGISLDHFESHPNAAAAVTTTIQRIMTTGAIGDQQTLKTCLQKTFEDLTFLEAYEKTGRILNVSIMAHNVVGEAKSKAMLLNYVTAPHVVIWSGVVASCAMPGLFTAVQLVQKDPKTKNLSPFLERQRWLDGSVACDLPKDRIASLFNVNFFIVSQTNPHVVPFMTQGRSGFSAHRLKKRRVLERVWMWLCNQMKYWLVKLYRFHLLPRHGGWEVPYGMCTQNYYGHVTIRPVGSVWQAIPDYFNLTTNATPEHLQYVVGNAQRQTWPHLNEIRHATCVERALTKAIDGLLLSEIREKQDNDQFTDQ